jgi:hypothetical protein
LAAQCGDGLHQLLDRRAQVAADALILAPFRNGCESDRNQPQPIGYIRVFHFAPRKCRPAATTSVLRHRMLQESSDLVCAMAGSWQVSVTSEREDLQHRRCRRATPNGVAKETARCRPGEGVLRLLTGVLGSMAR